MISKQQGNDGRPWIKGSVKSNLELLFSRRNFNLIFYVFEWYIDILWKYISWYLRTKTSGGLAVFYNLPSWFQSMHAYSTIAGRMKMCQKTHIGFYCPQQELCVRKNRILKRCHAKARILNCKPVIDYLSQEWILFLFLLIYQQWILIPVRHKITYFVWTLSRPILWFFKIEYNYFLPLKIIVQLPKHS